MKKYNKMVQKAVKVKQKKMDASFLVANLMNTIIPHGVLASDITGVTGVDNPNGTGKIYDINGEKF